MEVSSTGNIAAILAILSKYCVNTYAYLCIDQINLIFKTNLLLLSYSRSTTTTTLKPVCFLALIHYVPSTIFQLSMDGPHCIEPELEAMINRSCSRTQSRDAGEA